MATNDIKKWRDLSLLQKSAIIGGVGITAYALYKFAKGDNIKNAPVDYGQIPQVFSSGGVPILWDADPLAKELFTNFEGYNFNGYPETTDKLIALNNDQLRLLYNHYNTYYANEYPTLTKLLDAEWAGIGNDSYSRAVAKLKGIGLNEDAPNKINWQRFIDALTDENKAFNFPIKYPAIDFDKPTKNMFYITAGIISAGLVMGAVLQKK